jgi:putative SOS response-associated peptidase YedK
MANRTMVKAGPASRMRRATACRSALTPVSGRKDIAAMCARYTLTLEQAKLVLAGLIHIFAFAPRYNIGPAQRAPVLLKTPEGVKSEEMTWGFKSEWSKTRHLNAQAERIQQSSTFNKVLGQRCLVPMDGFYEWKSDKSPVRFVRRKRDVFYVAGLWKVVPRSREDFLSASSTERTKGKASKQIERREREVGGNEFEDLERWEGTSRSFVLLTTAANASVKPIHDRMPFIVCDDQFDWWLSDENLKDTVLNFPDDSPLEWYSVSREVNNVRNEGPDLIRPVPMERELF